MTQLQHDGIAPHKDIPFAVVNRMAHYLAFDFGVFTDMTTRLYIARRACSIAESLLANGADCLILSTESLYDEARLWSSRQFQALYPDMVAQTLTTDDCLRYFIERMLWSTLRHYAQAKGYVLTPSYQHAIMTYNPLWLMHFPDLFINHAVLDQAEAAHPGLQAAIDSVCALYDDRKDRTHALTQWLTTNQKQVCAVLLPADMTPPAS